MNVRLQKLKSRITKSDLDAILISHVSNIIYLTGFSGFSYFEREAFLVITNKQNFLITDGRYSEAVSKIQGFEVLEISNENPLEKILESLSKKIKKVGIEEYNLTVSESKKFKKYFRLISIKDLKNLRIIKEEDEILKIKKACQIGDEAFKHILGKIKSGVSEKELAFKLEYYIKKNNADISFPPIVAFGKNSTIPHHQTSDQRLKTNSVVLLDFGVKFENYCSDMTRTIFVGRADEKFKKIYQTVLESQKLAIEQFNNIAINAKWKMIDGKSIDAIARDYIMQHGFSTIPHSLGHGIGIEVHESPRLSPKSKDILKEGMVFSIEPGIYIPGYSGVRIEDLFVVENNKLRQLTRSPKNLLEI